MNSLLCPLLAVSEIGGSGLVHDLFIFLLIGICVCLIWWAGNWFIGKAGGPPLAGTIWTGLFVLVALIVVINFLMSLAGHPILKL